MQKQTLFIFLLLSVFISGCTSQTNNQIRDTQSTDYEIQDTQSVDNQIQSDQSYEVLKVIDGDTIKVDYNGVRENIRMIGIDTPETVDPRKPVQCFGPEASKKAKELLSGKRVFLEADDSQGDRDKYKRLLRYVFIDNETNFNQLMISEGFAREYTYNKPYKYQSQFRQAEREAKESLKGLWGACG